MNHDRPSELARRVALQGRFAFLLWAPIPQVEPIRQVEVQLDSTALPFSP